MAERHGGTASIGPAPGRGTTVRLRLPADRDAAAGSLAAPSPAASVVRPLRLLVVDDEPALGRLIAELLAPDGHAIVVVTSAEAARAHLAAVSGAIDLVLTDLRLGAGEDGWALAAHVRQHWPGTRVVLVTGWSTQLDPAELRAHGVVGVVAKPFSGAALRRAVTRAAALPN